MATPMLDPNHLRKVHVGEIKMKLPIPSFSEIEGVKSDSVRSKSMQRVLQNALKDIDLQELYWKLVEKTDNMAPLTEGEFKQIENQWVFIRVKQDNYLYLMFKGKSWLDSGIHEYYTKMFFADVRPSAKLKGDMNFDLSLYPSRKKDWESFRVLSYNDKIKDIINWGDVYLVKSYGMPSFMNWKGNPFVK